MSSTQTQLEAPHEPKVAPANTGWTGGRIAALVIGALLVLVSLCLLGSGGTASWAYLTKRDAGYVTTDVHRFATAGSALVTERTQLGAAGVGWLYSPNVLGTVRIRVTPTSPESQVFVGIGRSGDVDRYLSRSDHTIVSDFWSDKVEAVTGGRSPSAPGEQPFWVASSTGPGTRSLVWEPTDGSWTVVVMNADGRPGVDVGADLGAHMPALPWITLGLLVAGAVFLAGGAFLIVGAVRRGTG